MDQKPEKALPILLSLVKEDPENARALVDLGKAFDKLSRPEDSVHAYQAALRVDPNLAAAHYQLARVYKRLNRAAEFQRELDMAQKLQRQKREQEESLLSASGSRGYPNRQLGLPPLAQDASPGPESPP